MPLEASLHLPFGITLERGEDRKRESPPGQPPVPGGKCRRKLPGDERQLGTGRHSGAESRQRSARAVPGYNGHLGWILCGLVRGQPRGQGTGLQSDAGTRGWTEAHTDETKQVCPAGHAPPQARWCMLAHGARYVRTCDGKERKGNVCGETCHFSPRWPQEVQRRGLSPAAASAPRLRSPRRGIWLRGHLCVEGRGRVPLHTHGRHSKVEEAPLTPGGTPEGSLPGPSGCCRRLLGFSAEKEDRCSLAGSLARAVLRRFLGGTQLASGAELGMGSGDKRKTQK